MRVEGLTTTGTPGAAHTRGRPAKAREPRRHLPSCVCAPVMDRRDLDVLDVMTSVRVLVLDLKIGKLNRAVDDGQVMIRCPFLDLGFVIVSGRPSLSDRPRFPSWRKR